MAAVAVVTAPPRNPAIEKEIESLFERSQTGTKEMFLSNYRAPIALDPISSSLSLKVRISHEYAAAAKSLAAGTSAGGGGGGGGAAPTATAAAAAAPSSIAAKKSGSAAAAAAAADVKEDGEVDEKTEPVFVAPGMCIYRIWIWTVH